MRQQLTDSRKLKSVPISLPAPSGGWNARDPQTKMALTDALYLENLFPRSNSVELRKGCQLRATLPDHVALSSPHIVRTLMPYCGLDGEKQFFAICDDGIYDISTCLTGSAISGLSPTKTFSSTQAAWQFVNTTTAGGSFLFLCNGIDDPMLYDGATFTDLNATSTPPLTGSGLDVKDIIHASLYKSRLVVVEANSLSFWYGDINAIAGTLVEFPLHVLFKRGGHLVATANWTLDSGSGPEDRFVAITSEGEVAVYQGIDPSSADNFSLVGVFQLPRPLATRCVVKMGGDLGILTEAGLLSLTQALPSLTPRKSAAYTDKIDQAFKDYVQLYRDYDGWEALVYEPENALFINVPRGTSPVQCVMNMVNSSWCQFTGWNITAFCVVDNRMYFAANNLVYQAWIGQDDTGTAIVFRAKTAFYNMRSSGRLKRAQLVRPNFTTDSQVALRMGIDTDYRTADYGSGAVTVGPASLALWDSAYWDEAAWALEAVQAKWHTISQFPGSMLSLRMTASLKGASLIWNATDFICTAGGIL